MFARYIAIAPIRDCARLPAEGIPDRRPFAIEGRSTFDLERTGGYAPHEAVGKSGQVAIVFLIWHAWLQKGSGVRSDRTNRRSQAPAIRIACSRAVAPVNPNHPRRTELAARHPTYEIPTYTSPAGNSSRSLYESAFTKVYAFNRRRYQGKSRGRRVGHHRPGPSDPDRPTRSVSELSTGVAVNDQGGRNRLLRLDAIQ